MGFTECIQSNFIWTFFYRVLSGWFLSPVEAFKQDFFESNNLVSFLPTHPKLIP